MGAPFDRSVLLGAAHRVAPRLLGAELWSHDGDEPLGGRIVEVEAYRQDDPASHTYRGETPRCRTMFGPPGHLYVYFTYGMHWCGNVVVEAEGCGAAVLIRALEPLAGLDQMRRRRPSARRDRDLCSGPAKLMQAYGLEREADGVDLLADRSPLRLTVGEAPGTEAVRSGPRIGIRRATERPWRWWIDGNEHVSR